MYLEKTDKGVLELGSRQRTLGLKERAVLLLADGQKTKAELMRLMQVDESLLNQLLAEGYLRQQEIVEVEWPVSRKSRFSETAPAPLPAPSRRPSPTLNANPAQAMPESEMLTTQTIKVAADTFEGKRSLATARMFLFDIGERLLARRDPVLNAEFRERLRQAKDREGMLAVSRDLLHHIEAVAGATRADNISERLAALLPDDTTY